MKDTLSSLPRYPARQGEELPPPRLHWGSSILLLVGVVMLSYVAHIYLFGLWISAINPAMTFALAGFALFVLLPFLCLWDQLDERDR
jgi:hypothetical protein